MRSLVFLSVLFLFLSCAKKVNVNQEFFLKYGKEAVVTLNDGQEIKIKFDKSEESRCAPNVQCIWEGFANVNLTVNQDKDTLGLLQSQYPSIKSHSNFEVVLLDLTYPTDDDFGKQEKATAKLKVTQ